MRHVPRFNLDENPIYRRATDEARDIELRQSNLPS
jgi:hypothetical protein